MLPAQHKFTPAAREALANMDPHVVYRDQTAFDSALSAAFNRAGVKLGRTLSRRIREAVSAQDDAATPYRDAKGRPQPDPDLRDYDDIPLNEDVQSWFEREVLPHAPDAWLAPAEGRIGYAIPFARFFYEPEPLRSPGEIDRQIRSLEQETQALLAQLESA
jgi:type I restriction enzyme M protein